MNEPVKIMIVDDEADIRTIVRILLETKGYHIIEMASGEDAVAYCREHPDIDLVIMDIMMPDMDGIEACRRIRDASVVPVLFLTARTQDSDKVAAYTNGGDDYLVKPFSQTELFMKVDSLLRRYRVYHGKESLPQAEERLRIDAERHIVYKFNKPISLTDKEFDILQYLYENRGKTVRAVELYQHVWGEKYLPSSVNTVMVHILNLRKKLEDDPSNPTLIRTIWGKGYQID